MIAAITKTDQGPVCTQGSSIRARAEARQGEYRAEVLKAGWSRWGHCLEKEAAESGANFFLPEAFLAARKRQAQVKGVDERTLTNMLSSQAMCFNIFAPLATDKDLVVRILERVNKNETVF